MRAFVLPHAGAHSVELADVPTPQIDDDELLVGVRAVGVGIHDSYFLPGDAKYPFTIGIEAAGVVVEVGSRVSAHAPGDRIAFVSSMQPKGGTWAEYVAVKADAAIVTVPSEMDFVDAAAVPVAGNTVLRALRALDAVPAGGSLFIAGGSGAIGTLAIQLARHRGWRVGASASEQNHSYMRSLGAEMVVDYHDPAWAEQIMKWTPAGVHAAIAVQPDTTAGSLSVVRDGGSVVSISGDIVEPERGVHVQTVPYQTDVRDELADLMAQIASREMHVEVERVYPFDNALDALAKVQTRHARGKLVLRFE
ncbi:NADPH:quinone reductase-like Zn-dependent oxidoreductase [Antricoccus suffuscus]|uniref:NADPH:quinone reductase-like Zn-dependent oxidoreductase n=1 Tax=Antricoccus suffuscus TaxID=1629062 RepID=A0A2T1A2H3_9ACTN|nr:NADP-dependent oxidoreductase [Antricoccus suffuscus]PRZ42802.1 NADPH:quinone reductase-like Zn-dependent oxidoreductase [Antricoccus suffuscus]